MLALPKDGAALDVMKDNVELMRLVGEPPIVEKHVWALLAPNLTSDSDRLAGWICRREDAWSVEIWPRGTSLSKRSVDVHKRIIGQISVI
jgi:hypothetical protein